MAVGAGSIKRAAKANTDAAKSAQVKEAEVVKPVEAKKTTAAKKAPVKKAAPKKPAVKEQEQSANKVYHITEELPIYLL